jgi:hypothetical protein
MGLLDLNAGLLISNLILSAVVVGITGGIAFTVGGGTGEAVHFASTAVVSPEIDCELSVCLTGCGVDDLDIQPVSICEVKMAIMIRIL